MGRFDTVFARAFFLFFLDKMIFLPVLAWIYPTDRQLTQVRFGTASASVRKTALQTVQPQASADTGTYCCRFVAIVRGDALISDLYDALLVSLKQQYPDIP